MAYSYENVSNFLDFSVGFKPTGAFPLDVRTMFGSLAAAEAVAASAQPAGSSDSVYYYGMSITVVENDTVTKYTIMPDNTLKEDGTALIADNKSIEVQGTTIKLKDFGTKYYAYHEADEVLDGTYASVDQLPTLARVAYYQIGDVWYVNTPGTGWDVAAEPPKTSSYYTMVDGWKEGLEPKVRLDTDTSSYIISWYEPSTATVEGVSSIVSSVQAATQQNTEDIANLNTNMADEITRATQAEGALSNRITVLENEERVGNVVAGDTNGYIKVDGVDVLVYSLPVATTTVLGGVMPDGTSIAVNDQGQISVQAVDHTKVTGLQNQIDTAVEESANTLNARIDDETVKKTDVVASDAVAADVSSASEQKVMSEKAILNMLTWKTTM